MNILLLPFLHSVGIRQFIQISVKIALEQPILYDAILFKLCFSVQYCLFVTHAAWLLYLKLFQALLHIAVGLVEVALRDVDVAVDTTVGIAQRVREEPLVGFVGVEIAG